MRSASSLPAFMSVCAALLSAVVGCAQPRPYADLWVDARAYQAELAASRPPSDAVSGDTDPLSAHTSKANPTGQLTLHEAVALSLRQDPGLKAAGWAVTAAEADAMQQGRPPNPTLGLVVENFGATASDPFFNRQSLKLSQVIELGDKRNKRLKLGQATQRLRAWDYEDKRIAVASETAARYLAVVVSQQRLALAKKQLALAEAGHKIAADRVKAEVAPKQEQDRATARLALSRITLEQARQQLASDRADLVASWGAEDDRFETATGGLEDRASTPPLKTLKEGLVNSPAIQRWQDEIKQRERKWELEKANAISDPRIGAGAKYFPDAEDAAGLVELSVPLKVFDTNRDAVRAARLRIAQAHALRKQAITQASRKLARAYTRYQAANYALKALDSDALPASESAYQSALDAYKAGLTDYLTVVDAERTLLELRYRRLDSALRYHQAIIDIERITAQPLAPEPAKPSP